MVISPASHRTVPSGQYAPNIAVGVPFGVGQFKVGGAAGWGSVTLDLSGYDEFTDISGVLNNAYQTYKDTNTRVNIPAGTWTVNGTNFTSPARGRMALCGAGMGQTILMKRAGTGSMFTCGGGAQWGNIAGGPGAGGIVVTGLVQGQTSITISGADRAANNIYNGSMLQFYWKNMTDNAAIIAGATPVFSTRGNDFKRKQQVKITGISGNTVTFSPPIYHVPPVGLECRVYCGFPTEGADTFGFENMTFRVSDDYYDLVTKFERTVFLLWMTSYYGFWFLNCEFGSNNGVNYNLYLSDCLRFTMRGCYLHGVLGGEPNHALILMEGAYAGYVEDCILENGFPLVEINSSAGVVFHACYFKGPGQFNTNHGAHNFGILAVRCIFGTEMCDGYHGTAEATTIIGCWAYEFGLVKRRFSFNSNSYGNLLSSNSNIYGYDFILGFGVPYIGGSDPFVTAPGHPHSEFWGSPPVFPADWPYDPVQYVKLLTRESETSGVWEYQGTAWLWVGGAHCGIGLYGLGYVGCGTVLTEKQWRAGLESGGVLPPEGSIYQLFNPAADGYGEHNDDVWNSHDFRGNFNLSPVISNFPAQPIGSDTIWEPLGYTSPPAGDGINEMDWGACPWFDNGGVQHGFINRASVATDKGATHRDIPAGRRYVDGTIFTISNQVATPTFSPAPGAFGTAQDIAILCATSGATIHYTIDGSTPTAGSPVYSTPIHLALPSTTTIKAYALKATMVDSGIRSGLFTISAAPTAPTAPSALGATAVSTSQIDLAWTDNSNNETGFEILHGTASGFLSLLTTVAAGVTSYNHTALSPSTAHFYRVQAVNAAGASSPTAEATATTLAPPSGGTVFDFPPGPAVNAPATTAGRNWKFNGTGWRQV